MLNIQKAKEENDHRIPKKRNRGASSLQLLDTPQSFDKDSEEHRLLQRARAAEAKVESELTYSESPLNELDDLENSPLEGGRRFFRRKLGSVADSRSLRLQQRSQSMVQVHVSQQPSMKSKKKKNEVIEISESSQDEDDFEEDLTFSDIKIKAHKIVAACELLSANLKKELNAWEGGAANQHSCVDLTSIKSGAGMQLLSDDDFKDICPGLALKAYQLVGINWLKLLHQNHVNGVLADDMV
jgi:SNF2 family DNA or RNA helicase